MDETRATETDNLTVEHTNIKCCSDKMGTKSIPFSFRFTVTQTKSLPHTKSVQSFMHLNCACIFVFTSKTKRIKEMKYNNLTSDCVSFNFWKCVYVNFEGEIDISIVHRFGCVFFYFYTFNEWKISNGFPWQWDIIYTFISDK